MAETNGSLLQQLDPKSLILSQFPDLDKPQLLQLTTESFILERGPRFKEYSDLREKKLRMKRLMDKQSPEKNPEEKIQNRSILTPPKKQVKFSSNFSTPPKRPKPPSVLAQSVPDFSSALRKENRRPLPPVAELTPPAKSGRVGGGGSKSANSTEKRCGGMMARKSYASMAELKGFPVESGNAINGENRGGRKTNLFGYRQF